MNKPTKQTTAPAIKQTPTVAECEAMLAEFEKQRVTLIEQHEQHATKRREISFAAHSGDAQASRLLDGLHEESVRFESRLASITDAINEARRRLQQAHEHEAREADRAKAVELRAALKRFVEHGAGVDAALEVLVESCNGMERALVEMHRCGTAFPSDAQLQSLGGRVLLAGLSKTPFRRNFETLPPLERDRSMARITQQWSDTVERSIQQRLGDQTNEAV
jgi:hypothetical protein